MVIHKKNRVATFFLAPELPAAFFPFKMYTLQDALLVDMLLLNILPLFDKENINN